MRHAYVVTWGTRSCIVAAANDIEAVNRIIPVLRVETRDHGSSGPTRDDLLVRRAEPRDWRTLDYYGGSLTDQTAVRDAMRRDQLTT